MKSSKIGRPSKTHWFCEHEEVKFYTFLKIPARKSLAEPSKVFAPR